MFNTNLKGLKMKSFEDCLQEQSDNPLKALGSLPGVDKVEKSGNKYKAIRYVKDLTPETVKKEQSSLASIVSGAYGKIDPKDIGWGTIKGKNAVWVSVTK